MHGDAVAKAKTEFGKWLTEELKRQKHLERQVDQAQAEVDKFPTPPQPRRVWRWLNYCWALGDVRRLTKSLRETEQRIFRYREVLVALDLDNLDPAIHELDAVKALFRDRRFSESRTWDHFRSNAEILQLELKHQSSMRMLFGDDPPINLSERRRT